MTTNILEKELNSTDFRCQDFLYMENPNNIIVSGRSFDLMSCFMDMISSINISRSSSSIPQPKTLKLLADLHASIANHIKRHILEVQASTATASLVEFSSFRESHFNENYTNQTRFWIESVIDPMDEIFFSGLRNIYNIRQRLRDNISPDFSSEIYRLAENIVDDNDIERKESIEEWAKRIANIASKNKD